MYVIKNRERRTFVNRWLTKWQVKGGENTSRSSWDLSLVYSSYILWAYLNYISTDACMQLVWLPLDYTSDEWQYTVMMLHGKLLFILASTLSSTNWATCMILVAAECMYTAHYVYIMHTHTAHACTALAWHRLIKATACMGLWSNVAQL